MGRANKAYKERKAKAREEREEREAKAAEEKKFPEASNNGAGMEPSSVSPREEVSAANAASLRSSSDRISDYAGAKSNALEFVREDERPEETVPVNETPHLSGTINEKGKQFGRGNGAVAQGGRAEPGNGWGNGAIAEGGRAQPGKGWENGVLPEGVWPQPGKGGDVLGKASSAVRSGRGNRVVLQGGWAEPGKGWGNGAIAEGGRAQPGKGWENGALPEGVWPEPGKGGDVLGKAPSAVILQPSELEVPVNETANGSHSINEKGKESRRGNGVVAQGGGAQPGKGWGNTAIAEGGWAQSVKGGDMLGKTSSVVRLQPSELEARQRPRVEASNPVGNNNYRGGYSGQNGTGGWGDSRTAGNGRDGVRGGYGHQASASRVDESTRINSLGRLLSSVLRHRAAELGLNMRSDGYVLVQDLLNLRSRTHAGLPLSSYTVDDIKEAVRLDNKQRFGLREENGQLLIRANQGHSVSMVTSEDLLSPVTSPEEVPVCVHGTYLKYLDAIQKEGLKRMNRHHVHFATGLFKDKRVTSGMRNNCEVLIRLNVQEYLKDGMKLYRSENGVILAEGKNGVISPKYFAKVERVRR